MDLLLLFCDFLENLLINNITIELRIFAKHRLPIALRIPAGQIETAIRLEILHDRTTLLNEASSFRPPYGDPNYWKSLNEAA